MAATKNVLIIATVILNVSVLIPSAFGIKCYQCNSFENSDCEHLIPSNATHSPFLKECESPHGLDKPMFCRKIVHTIVAAGADHKRVIRKCSYEKSEKQCYHFEDEDHSEVVCQCFDDACNRGDRGISTISVWRTLTPLLAVLASSIVAAVI